MPSFTLRATASAFRNANSWTRKGGRFSWDFSATPLGTTRKRIPAFLRRARRRGDFDARMRILFKEGTEEESGTQNTEDGSDIQPEQTAPRQITPPQIQPGRVKPRHDLM